MIRKIEVKKLFGVFHHIIPLNEDQRITLILGENGLGKTIVLKLVKAFYENNFHELKDNIFEELILSFVDNSQLSIKRIVDKGNCTLIFELSNGKKKKLTYEFKSGNKIGSKRKHFDQYYHEFYDRPMTAEYYRMKEYRRNYNDELSYLIDRFLPMRVERVGVDKWLSPHNGLTYSSDELLTDYAEFLPPEIRERFGQGIPKWLSELVNSVKIKLIETQRLLTPLDEGKYKSSVTNYSNQLIETIKNKRSESTDLGSNLDRTYPTRVIDEIANSTSVSNDFIRSSFIELQNKRALLNNVGLLDTDDGDLQPNINHTFDQKILKEVLKVYIDDSNKKLAIYDDLSKRIKLLLDIINKRFTYKRLSIDKNKGFVFSSTINNKEIPLSGLSSGEQHELVLYFELLFNTKENSLLLIDEPEISLHISWQKQFITDLTSVTTLNNLSVIIATHSPDIIGNHWPLTVQLNGIS